MSANWYCVYLSESGLEHSFGTVLADPMPGHLAIKQLLDAETAILLNGSGVWDPQQLAIVPRPAAFPES